MWFFLNALFNKLNYFGEDLVVKILSVLMLRTATLVVAAALCGVHGATPDAASGRTVMAWVEGNWTDVARFVLEGQFCFVRTMYGSTCWYI